MELMSGIFAVKVKKTVEESVTLLLDLTFMERKFVQLLSLCSLLVIQGNIKSN